MGVIDKKKLETAILYLQRIADGKNPVNNMIAEEDAVLNNPNVIRCMFFVKEVLEEVQRNDGYIGSKPKQNKKQDFPLEVLKDFQYQEDKSITKIAEQINQLVDTTCFEKLSYKTITQWLKGNGFLMEEHNPDTDKMRTLPTEKGIKLGIRTEKRIHSGGTEYICVLYEKQAQEYIIQNMSKILNL